MDFVEHARRRHIIGMKSVAGAEILRVPGGGGGAFVVRSTGRKDRHSKVSTAKGLRDRRVRLSAHTAIQFYDVQDRLGYDRPSKAVDWLIRKAKSAIDKLFELPNPVTHPFAPNETDPNGIESESINDFLFQSQLGENFTTPAMDSSGDFQSYGDLGLSLQTQNYTAGSGNSGLEFDGGFERIVAWTGNDFGSQPNFNRSSAASPLRGPLQSSFESPVTHYAWNDLSVATAGKRHPIPIPIPHFISDGLPHLDVNGRFQNDGDGGKASFDSPSFSGR